MKKFSLGYKIILLIIGLLIITESPQLIKRSFSMSTINENHSEKKLNSSSVTLNLLTLNFWLTPINLPSSNTDKRVDAFIDNLTSKNYSIICLQEVFKPELKKRLIENFENDFFVHKDTCSERAFLFIKKDCHGGLLTFSKYPINNETFYKFPEFSKFKLDERIAQKGFLITEIETPIGKILIINIHLCAGRTYNSALTRLKQIKFFLKILENFHFKNKPVLLMGDFNIRHPKLTKSDKGSPDIELYNILTDSLGFNEATNTDTEINFTYDIMENSYANMWYNRFEGRQIFDYIFYRTPFKTNLLKYEIVFKKPTLVSDHFGVSVIIRIDL